MNTGIMIWLGGLIGITSLFWSVVWLVIPKGSTASSGSTNEFWKKHGNDIKALALIAVALGFINWLCFLIGWKWWLSNWENRSLFFVSQISIVFAFYTFMFAKKIGAHIFAALLLITIFIGWITVAKKHSPTETSGANKVSTAFQPCLNDGAQIAQPRGEDYHYETQALEPSIWAPIRGLDVNVYYLNGEKVLHGLTFEFQDVNGRKWKSDVGGDTNSGNTHSQVEYVRYWCNQPTYFTVVKYGRRSF